MDQYKFPANNIYNVDETGISTVQGRPTKIIAKMGRQQVGSLVSAERGQLVTAVICMSVAGSFIPPLFIFPRFRLKDELMNGSLPGSLYEFHKTWIYLQPGLSTLSGRLELQKQPCAVYLGWPFHSH